MFAKVFEQIFDSSIADDPYLRHFFMDLLVLADPDGVVDMTPNAIAARTRLPIQDVERWLAGLEQPDAQSRSPDHEGRRLARLDPARTWGWRIVNFAKYRESASKNMLRMAEAQRKAEYRRRHGGCRPPPPTPPPEAEAEADKSRTCHGHVSDQETPPSPRNGKLSASERISLERQVEHLREQLKAVLSAGPKDAFGDWIGSPEAKVERRSTIKRLRAEIADGEARLKV